MRKRVLSNTERLKKDQGRQEIRAFYASFHPCYQKIKIYKGEFPPWLSRKFCTLISHRQLVGPYSQAIAANGFVFTSGQVPIDPKAGKIVATTIEEQTEQVMKNLQCVLAQGGVGFDRVVKTTCFLSDINDFRCIQRRVREVLPGRRSGSFLR